MKDFVLLSTPIWINLLILVPIILLFYWRKNKLLISRKTLLYALIFGIAFGVIEATCVIYLRASTGMLPGFEGNIFDVWKMSEEFSYSQEVLRETLPMSLLVFEIIREAGTIIMLGMIAFIAANRWRERVAIFLWTFAAWDIVYYLHLWLMVRWPSSLTTPDVLFLIPEPWIGQVWFPLLVSGSTMLAVISTSKNKM
ncbi:MAG: hypothetical protein KBD51_03215 [Candidatus Levybacteria bacterium]|nr:hypothetical protein [Candidatus Levybacteria bacterium]